MDLDHIATVEQLELHVAARARLLGKLDARIRMAVHSSQTKSPAKVSLEEARTFVEHFRDMDARWMVDLTLTHRAMERLGVLESVSATRKAIAREDAAAARQGN